MRIALLGVLIGAGLTVVTLGASPNGDEGLAQRAGGFVPGQAEGGLIAFCNVVDGKYQQLTVIDPKRMAMSVYHVELATGAIELKCVRTIQWDLQMTRYNGRGLLPEEIHSLQEQPR
jgi:hypothetical protein